MIYNSLIKRHVLLYNVFPRLLRRLITINNVSSAYMYMLDSSKAFDRVNLLTLFKTLYSRGMCPIYLRLLMKIYEVQNMRIRWNNTVTDYFTISNGIKQGGVLSLILFSLDQLISRLRHIGMGRHMNGLFTGVCIYAHDITLLVPSRGSLALMLEQCDIFLRTHDILFNASKTKSMIFKRLGIENGAPLYFKDSPINGVHACDLLGITLSSNRTTDNVEVTLWDYISNNLLGFVQIRFISVNLYF